MRRLYDDYYIKGKLCVGLNNGAITLNVRYATEYAIVQL